MLNLDKKKETAKLYVLGPLRIVKKNICFEEKIFYAFAFHHKRKLPLFKIKGKFFRKEFYLFAYWQRKRKGNNKFDLQLYCCSIGSMGWSETKGSIVKLFETLIKDYKLNNFYSIKKNNNKFFGQEFGREWPKIDNQMVNFLKKTKKKSFFKRQCKIYSQVFQKIGEVARGISFFPKKINILEKNKHQKFLMAFLNIFSEEWMKNLKDFYNIWPLEQWVLSLTTLILLYWLTGHLYNRWLSDRGGWLDFKLRIWLIISDLVINLTLGLYYMHYRETLMGSIMLRCPIAISPMIFLLEMICVYVYYRFFKKN